MAPPVKYILHDAEGDIRQWGECAEELVDAHQRDGLALKRFAWGDDIGDRRVDAAGRVRLRRTVDRLEASRAAAIDAIDSHFALLQASVTGPFAEAHRMKREQASAGGGPLILDEEERLAVLAAAQQQDALLAAIEAERMAVKRAARAAGSIEELKAIQEEAGLV